MDINLLIKFNPQISVEFQKTVDLLLSTSHYNDRVSSENHIRFRLRRCHDIVGSLRKLQRNIKKLVQVDSESYVHFSFGVVEFCDPTERNQSDEQLSERIMQHARRAGTGAFMYAFLSNSYAPPQVSSFLQFSRLAEERKARADILRRGLLHLGYEASELRDLSYQEMSALGGRSWVGNKSCINNAQSRHLRCAINPSGPCDGCQHFESSSSV